VAAVENTPAENVTISKAAQTQVKQVEVVQAPVAAPVLAAAPVMEAPVMAANPIMAAAPVMDAAPSMATVDTTPRFAEKKSADSFDYHQLQASNDLLQT
jgi:hypothetical protein